MFLSAAVVHLSRGRRKGCVEPNGGARVARPSPPPAPALRGWRLPRSGPAVVARGSTSLSSRTC